jgi:hypothetical protein
MAPGNKERRSLRKEVAGLCRRGTRAHEPATTRPPLQVTRPRAVAGRSR